MSEKSRQSGGNFLVQGSILAAAGIIVRLIGLLYKNTNLLFCEYRSICMRMYTYSEAMVSSYLANIICFLGICCYRINIRIWDKMDSSRDHNSYSLGNY